MSEKEYVKPTIDAVELRLEERVARCFDQPKPKQSKGNDNGGNTPGLPGSCPGGS